MTERDLIDYGYVSDTIEHEDFTQMVFRYANGTVKLEDGTMMSASEYDHQRNLIAGSETSLQSRSVNANSTSEPAPSWNITTGDVDGNRK
jgi:hypothetical protein